VRHGEPLSVRYSSGFSHRWAHRDALAFANDLVPASSFCGTGRIKTIG